MHRPIVARPAEPCSPEHDNPLVDVLNEHELTNHLRERAAEIGFDAALAEATGGWWQTNDEAATKR